MLHFFKFLEILVTLDRHLRRRHHHLEFQITIQKRYNLMTPEAERFNGWAAMLGVVAAIGAYATTGQVIPGIF